MDDGDGTGLSSSMFVTGAAQAVLQVWSCQQIAGVQIGCEWFLAFCR
ncbi:hypothetical protein KCP76_17205 [Salmonella enterica subsp. enterica serovar Weltevreden]|nr:hypothetical protein KCP76_17205 [Salmonella enterica subsp. enterica serovar Weltevreden]